MREILVGLFEIRTVDTLLCTLLDAVAHAAWPSRLCFAVSTRFEEALRGEAFAALAGCEIRTFPEENGLAGLAGAAREERYFLSLKGGFRFSEKWEQGLLSRSGRLPGSLLTGMLSGDGEYEKPQAYLPAVKEDFRDKGVLLSRGMALVCAAGPVRTMLVNPGLLFGRVELLTLLDTAWDTLSICAQLAGVPVYALEKPLLWPSGRQRERRLRRPEEGTVPAVSLARFEKLAGISFGDRAVAVRTEMGLFSAENGYLQAAPPGLVLKQRAQTLWKRAGLRSPLLVTALLELPQALHPALSYRIHFDALARLRRAPVLLYAGGSCERELRGSFPNTLSYPDNGVLPRSLLAEGMSEMQHMMRSKLMLLSKTARQYPAFTHLAWVDCDVLPHPVYPEAALDFSSLMDSNVHIATVDGVPDTSFMIVPRERLTLLTRESQALTQVDAALKRSFSEVLMMKRLCEKYPDLFTLHPMTVKHALFWSGIDPSLLAEECVNALMKQQREEKKE